MELAPRNKELYKNLYKNEFPSIKVTPFDPELNSASNGDTFIDWNSFLYKFLYNSLFRGASFTSIRIIHNCDSYINYAHHFHSIFVEKTLFIMSMLKNTIRQEFAHQNFKTLSTTIWNYEQFPKPFRAT
jgi:hypothetical protein